MAYVGKKAYKCAKCGKIFDNEHGLRVHNVRMHGKQKKRESQVLKPPALSGRIVADSSAARAKKKKALPFVCSRCGKTFDRERGLRTHNARMHGKMKNWRDKVKKPVIDPSCRKAMDRFVKGRLKDEFQPGLEALLKVHAAVRDLSIVSAIGVLETVKGLLAEKP